MWSRKLEEGEGRGGGRRCLPLECDLESETAEHIAEDRTQESLANYYKDRFPQQLAGIEDVAMDMWMPYFPATRV